MRQALPIWSRQCILERNSQADTDVSIHITPTQWPSPTSIGLHLYIHTMHSSHIPHKYKADVIFLRNVCSSMFWGDHHSFWTQLCAMSQAYHWLSYSEKEAWHWAVWLIWDRFVLALIWWEKDIFHFWPRSFELCRALLSRFLREKNTSNISWQKV